jgi:hypothetical protein
MIQNVLREIGGVGTYGVISVCLFFAVFAGALAWAFLQKKSDLQSISTLPLEKDEPGPNTKGDPCDD